MRVSDYIQIAQREITRQRVRSALTILALAISTVILVALAAISLGGRQAITTKLAPDDSLASIIVTSNKTSGAISLFGSVQEANDRTAKLDDSSLEQLRSIPGVKQVSPRANIWELQKFSVAGSSKTFVAQTQGWAGQSSMKLSQGSTFSTSSAHEVIIGQAYLRDLGLSSQGVIGKQITLTTQNGYRGEGATIPGARATQKQYDDFNRTPSQLTATIVGVTTGGTDENKLLIPMEWARQIRTAQISATEKKDYLAEDGYSSMVVTTATPAAVKPVSTAIDDFGYGQVSTQSIIEKLTQFSTIMWFILGSVALVALLAASLGIVNTMLMTVSEQRYVIGVWRAVGARKHTIAGLFLVQAAFLGVIGGVLGAAAGWYASTLVNRRIAEILQTQNLPAVDIAAAPLWLCVGSVVLAVVFAVVAGLYPAWRAARQDPSKILHSI
jgi:ABC-type antimicrobial peptide transport system permease subunit